MIEIEELYRTALERLVEKDAQIARLREGLAKMLACWREHGELRSDVTVAARALLAEGDTLDAGSRRAE